MIIQPGEYLSAATILALANALQSAVLITFIGHGGATHRSGIVVAPTLVLTYHSKDDPPLRDLQQPARCQVNGSHLPKGDLWVEGATAVAIVEVDLPPEETGMPPNARGQNLAGAFLRLSHPMPAPPPGLNVTTGRGTSQSGWVFLLSYPMGRSEPVVSIGDLLGAVGPILKHDANSGLGSGAVPYWTTMEG
ncbi:MAG: hypothetical protein IPK82_42980 [Polyangiaceae bacterium]|nr:hypothetical protein [Polyangiaceae bacterium]